MAARLKEVAPARRHDFVAPMAFPDGTKKMHRRAAVDAGAPKKLCPRGMAMIMSQGQDGGLNGFVQKNYAGIFRTPKRFVDFLMCVRGIK